MRRRDLLRGAALGSSLLALPAAGRAAADAQQPVRRVGIAVVGLGEYARFCLPRLAQARRARLAGLVSGDGAKAAAIAAEYGLASDAIRDYRQFDRIVDDERIDAVHLCLPVGLHAEYAGRALAAGKHVLCEKPLAHDSAAARRLIATAARAGRVLMPAYRARYAVGVAAVLQRLPELGPLASIDAHKGFAMALPAGNWRFDPALAGGGALFDIGPYSLQLTRWFAGGMPTRVQAFHGAWRDDARYARVEPHTGWLMEFGSGLVATGSASWRYRLQNHATVAGPSGWMRLDPATPALGERLTIGRDAPLRSEEPALPPRDQLPLMYDDFAGAILERRAPQVDAQEGLLDLLLIEALLASARSGRPEAPAPA
jgi:predicted dehydrogenase